MPFCKLYYHLTWATNAREPLLVEEIESTIHDYLRAKAVGLGGFVYAVNGDLDHVHMVVSIPPTIAVANFVGQVKGASSSRINKNKPLYKRFNWQEEYGAFTFDQKRLPRFIAYVERQKEHHRMSTTIPVLERTGSSESIDAATVREPLSVYDEQEDEWVRELNELMDDEDMRDK